MFPHSPSCRHIVHFYKEDGALRSSVGAYIADALRQGRSVLVIATPDLRQQLTIEVHRQHVQVAPFGPERGRFVTMDAAATLDQFCVDGTPDVALFRQVLGAALQSLSSGGKQVAAYGEMVGILCERGQYADAVRLEAMWNELLAASKASLYCGYPSRLFAAPAARPFHAAIRAAHTEAREEPALSGAS